MRNYFLHPGDPIRAVDLNDAFGEVSRQSQLSATPPIQITDDGAGTTFSWDDGSFLAVIMDPVSASSGSCGGYGFKEVQPDDCGDWVDKPGGKQQEAGAFEWNDFKVPQGSVARLFPTGQPGQYAFWYYPGGSGSGIVTGGDDCPIWSCCLSGGCVTCGPNPDDPSNDAWLGMACVPWDQPGSGGFFDPEGNDGDPNCGFWSCDDGSTPCPDWPAEACGCTDNETAAGCYPYWGKGADAIDLQSTGISLACLFGCRDGQLVVRKACLNIVPGGPFGLRLALIAKANGRELHSPTDGDF